MHYTEIIVSCEINGLLMQVMQGLNHLGVCQSASSTLHQIDLLCKECDTEIDDWKSILEHDNKKVIQESLECYISMYK